MVILNRIIDKSDLQHIENDTFFDDMCMVKAVVDISQELVPPRLKDALISEKVRFPNSLQCEYEELCVFRGVRYTATKTAIDKSDFLLRYRRNRVRFSHQSSEKQGGWVPTGRQVCCRPGSKGKN